MTPRRASLADLAGIVALEEAAFDAPRRSSPRSLRRSLTSDRQSVWVLGSVDASLVLWHFPKTIRIYGVAVHPDLHGKGLGRALVMHAEELALEQGAQRILLEADAGRPDLLRWYQRQGYTQTATKKDFYGRGRHAIRFEKAVRQT